jgi:hypothetical protein
VQCPKGTVLRRGQCVTIERERCPRGTIGTPPNCRKLQIQQISPDLQQLLQPRQPSDNKIQ